MQKDDQKPDINPGKIALTISESAYACGVCDRTIRDRVKRGEIPAARVGSRILILRSNLIAWLEGITDTSGELVRPDISAIVSGRNQSRVAR
ncbi:hypothetical protein SDC9_11683 [bioreactor metagenome]|uniref:Helix-turn-helix domain-containing protein n=1 Tax=bioreactor metagenome TaxID=1076179 RepID=A0A644TGB3_9ZZZZ